MIIIFSNNSNQYVHVQFLSHLHLSAAPEHQSNSSESDFQIQQIHCFQHSITKQNIFICDGIKYKNNAQANNDGVGDSVETIFYIQFFIFPFNFDLNDKYDQENDAHEKCELSLNTCVLDRQLCFHDKQVLKCVYQNEFCVLFFIDFNLQIWSLQECTLIMNIQIQTNIPNSIQTDHTQICSYSCSLQVFELFHVLQQSQLEQQSKHTCTHSHCIDQSDCKYGPSSWFPCACIVVGIKNLIYIYHIRNRQIEYMKTIQFNENEQITCMDVHIGD
jgi:hypothetical protein